MSLGGHSLLNWHNHDWDVLLKGKNKYIQIQCIGIYDDAKPFLWQNYDHLI